MSLLGAIAIALVLGCAVPWFFMRMLVPSLREGRTTQNYRGREVFLGLGVVWLVWAGCALIGGVASAMFQGESSSSILPILALAGPLALVAFALGMVDDALGNESARGFRGHLSALAKGRLTTGGMKLFGISLASFFAALVLADVSPWASYAGTGGSTLNAGIALLAGAAIALTSNFVNLTDLRPGRALKVSTLLMTAGVLSAGLLMPASSAVAGADMSPLGGVGRAVDALALGLFVLGPIVAVYRYDMAEMGMLGDAGANPMGAVAGLLIVSGLPLWGLLVYLATMLFLNAASERISFSKVIESNGFLRWFDSLGRLTDDGTTVHSRL